MIEKLKDKLKSQILDSYPEWIINRVWKKKFGYDIDWDNPRDINEIIQWLLVKSDTTEWTRLADKLKVRGYLIEKGLSDLLVPLYGTWDKADDIDYDSLPEKFVLKCNHDSSSTVIINKAIGFDKDKINIFLNSCLNRSWGNNGELHYRKINPRKILAEQYLEQNNEQYKDSLIDYKVWCLGGASYVMVYSHRKKTSVMLDVYDLDWKAHPEFCLYNEKFIDGQGVIPKPNHFNEMISAAETLASGFPEVRVDFYDTGEKLYFGEMTFSGQCGMMQHFTPAFLKMMGDKVDLSNVKLK